MPLPPAGPPVHLELETNRVFRVSLNRSDRPPGRLPPAAAALVRLMPIIPRGEGCLALQRLEELAGPSAEEGTMSGRTKVRANRRLLLPALAAAAVALASVPRVETPAGAAEIVVKSKGKTEAAPGDTLSDDASREEYYLRFDEAAPADSAAPDTTEYYLEFEPPPDTTAPGAKLYEIYIDDDGIVADTVGSGAAFKIGASMWDESECEEEPERYTSCPLGGDRVDFGLDLGYQRVDGLSIGLRQDLDHGDWRVPKIRLREIYSSRQDKWFYDVGIEQRLVSFLPLYAGASVYKITDSNPLDKQIIQDTENTIAAFFFKEDYRDYFTRSGTTLNARLDLPAGNSFKIEYMDDEYASLERRADWSLFRGSHMFRPNPPIEEGDMKSVALSYTLDTVNRHRCVPNGALVRLSVERAGERIGGDFDFTTVTLDARNYVKLNPSQFLRYRFMLGSRRDGRLPVQRQFYVGGIGTLRGHDYKELTGDQMLLGNIEYGAYAGRDVGLYMFVDSGKAWYGDGGFADQRLELDVGVGVEILCEGTQIYAAKDVKDSDSPILVGVRLNRTF
jgi:hypothetical protein